MDKAIMPPGENATQDELAAYFKALGVPESLDGYTFDPEKLPKDLELTEEITKWMREVSHKNHLTKQQSEALLVDMTSRVTETLKQQGEEEKRQEQEDEQKKEKAIQALKDDWKDQYETRISRAHKTALGLFGEEFIKHADDSGIGNDLYVLRMLDILGEVQLPDRLLKGKQIAAPEGKTEGLSYPWMRDFYGKPSE